MRTLVALAFLATLTLSACNGDTTNSNGSPNRTSNANNAANLKPVEPIKPAAAVDPAFKSCNPYFPLIPGSQYKYSIKFSSGLIADATVVVDETRRDGKRLFKETTQIVDRSGGMEKYELTAREYECDGERVNIVSEKTDNRVQDIVNTVEMQLKGVATYLVDPASLGRNGTAWSYSFTQAFQKPGEAPIYPADPIVVNFTIKNTEEVSVPAGKFNAVKIGRKVKDREGHDYYTKGVGLVKRVGAEGTTVELTEYSGVSPAK